MFRFGWPERLWRAPVVLCLVLVGLVLVSQSAISKPAIADQTIYSFQPGIPAAIPNFIDLSAGCNWAGIGGQVFDQTGSPVTGFMVKVSGIYDGHQVLQYVYTGTSQYFGPGGFDLKLGNRPIFSQTVRLQLLDAAGTPLSLPFAIRTYDTCQQNIVVINLTPIALDHTIFLPQIPR